MDYPKVVSRDAWLVAREELLAKEKEFTRQRDALNAERRKLPRVKIDKEYVFEGPAGKLRLLDLFDGRRQLIVYHFMFDPSWDEGCPMCSFLVDNIGHLAHLHARDTSLAVVSRATLAKIQPLKKQMGHVTLDENVAPAEYNYRDKAAHEKAGMPWFTKGELPGLSVFLREGNDVFHTYSTYARGGDLLIGTYNYLDLTPLGRQEGWGGTEDLNQQGDMWVRHHDKYRVK